MIITNSNGNDYEIIAAAGDFTLVGRLKNGLQVEFVVVSYLHENEENPGFYSWAWGHYFTTLEAATEYFNSKTGRF